MTLQEAIEEVKRLTEINARMNEALCFVAWAKWPNEAWVRDVAREAIATNSDDTPMTASEAIDALIKSHDGKDFTLEEIDTGNWGSRNSTAIATILNAVVKGELK